MVLLDPIDIIAGRISFTFRVAASRAEILQHSMVASSDLYQTSITEATSEGRGLAEFERKWSCEYACSAPDDLLPLSLL